MPGQLDRFRDRLKKHAYPLGLAAIFSLFFLFRFFRLGYSDFWFDEIGAVSYANFPWGNWNAPLYYILLHYWVKIFGISEFSMRLPSLIFSFFSVVLLYLLGKKLFNRKTGIIASIFIGLSPLHLWYAQEARDYAMVLFFGLFSSLLFFMALKKDKIKPWLAFVLVSAVGLYTSYFYIFLFLSQCSYLLYIRKFKVRYKEIVSFLVAMLVFSFFLQRFFGKFLYVKGGFWVPVPEWGSLLITVENFILGYSATPLLYFISDILVGVFFVWSLFSVYRKKELRDGFLFCLFLSLLPVAMVFLFSRMLFSVYLDRGLIIFSPFFYLALSIGISFSNRKIIKGFLLALLIVLTLVSGYAYFNGKMPMPVIHHTGAYVKKPIKPVIEFLANNTTQQDIIAFTNNSVMSQLHFYGNGKFNSLYYFFDPQVLNSDWRRPMQESKYCLPFQRIGQLQFEKLWVLACDCQRSGNLDDNSHSLKKWLDSNFQLEFTKEFDGLWIFRYAKRKT